MAETHPVVNSVPFAPTAATFYYIRVGLKTTGSADSESIVQIDKAAEVKLALTGFRYEKPPSAGLTMTIGGEHFSGILKNLDFYDFYVETTQ